MWIVIGPVARLGERHERLERQVHGRLRAERVLEHVVGLRKRRLGVAATQMEIERNVGAFAPGEVLQVGKRAGGLQQIVHDGAAGHGLDFVVDRRQLVVFGAYKLRRFLCHMRIVGEHHRNRLADVPHLLQRQDRLIVERRSVIRIGDELEDVLAGDHRMHARELAACAVSIRRMRPCGTVLRKILPCSMPGTRIW